VKTSSVYALLLSLVSLPALATGQAPVIEISGANFRAVPVAYPVPSSEAARPFTAEFDAALNFDLTASGLFQVLDRKGFTAKADEGMGAASINFSRWQDVGAEMLVKANLVPDGDQVRGELRLFNVVGAKEDFRTERAVPARDARRLAHFLADALYRNLTHEPPPFSTHLAFVKKVGQQGKDVFLSDWDGKNALLVSQGGINLLPTVLPSGEGVAFTSYKRGKPEIFSQRPGGAANPLVAVGQMTTGAAFSPDGKRLAFSVADGEGAQIWVSSAEGSGARAITDTNYFINSSPAWSPDGKRLAFVSNRGGSPQVYVMNADGTGVKRLSFQGNYNQTPAWSPRGDVIAFTARDERNAFDIFTINVTSGKVNRLTQDQGNNEEPTFSPNGRLLIFTSTRRGPSELYVMTVDGNNQLPLPVERGDYTTPDWGR
jgi:TolB protein